MCWISATDPKASISTKLIIIAMYGGLPVTLGIIISIVGYGVAIHRMRQLPIEIQKFLNINVYKLLWYPVVLFVIFVPSVANGFYQNYRGTITNPAFEIIYLALTHSIGFVNAIVYGLQRKLYHFGKEKNQNDYANLSFSDSINSATENLMKAKCADL